MPKGPRIGVTSSAGLTVDGKVVELRQNYRDAVERTGATVVELVNDATTVDEVLGDVDGLLLTGGVDVDPARYGGNPRHSRSEAGLYQEERDAFEIALVRAAFHRAVPILAICRGMQVANVALGGTLIEDLRDKLGERYTVEHRQVEDLGLSRGDYAPEHDVMVKCGSALARITRRTSFPTNSLHHQALATLGNGLAMVGRTPDGVVEAVEATFEHPFFIGVQWHPEDVLGDAVSEALFRALSA